MPILIDLNMVGIIEKVTSDRFGRLVSEDWKRLINPYTPRDTGTMEDGAIIRPWEIEYKGPYARYMYEGRLYVDPIYGVGAFYNPMYGFWSRKIEQGGKKIPTSKPLNYNTGMNKYATDHWDIKAAQAGQLDKLYQALNDKLQKNKI